MSYSDAHASTPSHDLPPTPHDVGRRGAWLIGLAFVALLAWAALAPLDEGTPCQGTVVVDTKRKLVQHPAGGVIQEVMVGEGAVVAAGQLLIRLDHHAARSAHEAARIRHLDLQAQLARLKAEQAHAGQLQFPQTLREAANDPAAAELLAAQQRLFTARRAALQAELDVLTVTLQGQESALRNQQLTLRGRERQLALLREELLPLRELVAEGYAPLNRQRELQRQEADLEAGVADLQGSMARLSGDMATTRQRRITRLQDHQRDVESQLAEVARDAQIQHERLATAAVELQRVEIRAPVSGQVVSLAVQTVGGVIQPGQVLMEVVPLGEPMVLEARVAPHLIDRVAAGMDADVRFSSFPSEPLLVVAAKVQSVSADLVMPPQGAAVAPHYLARLKLTPEAVRILGTRRVQPGMPIEVVVKSGERSVLSYLLGPLTRRIAGAMKE